MTSDTDHENDDKFRFKRESGDHFDEFEPSFSHEEKIETDYHFETIYKDIDFDRYSKQTPSERAAETNGLSFGVSEIELQINSDTLTDHYVGLRFPAVGNHLMVIDLFNVSKIVETWYWTDNPPESIVGLIAFMLHEETKNFRIPGPSVAARFTSNAVKAGLTKGLEKAQSIADKVEEAMSEQMSEFEIELERHYNFYPDY